MSESASFSYDGNVALKIRGGNEVSHTKPVPTIEIQGVKHLIPVNVSCLVDGEPTTVTVYVDYTSMDISVPATTGRVVVDSEAFKKNLLEFYEERDRREAVEYEAREMADIEARRAAAKSAAATAANQAAESRVVTDEDGDDD